MTTSLFLAYTIIFLIAAVIVVPLSRWLGFGVVLGYLVAGLLIGPHGLRLVYDSENIMHFAELGVVFMLFVIGLELKPSRLWVMRKSIFGLGVYQVFLSTILLAPLFFMEFKSAVPAALCAIFLALSSTAFAVQMLAERNELNTEFGRGAFAILLFQDIFSIPLLAILPTLTVVKDLQSETASPWYVAVLTIVAILVVGRYFSRPIFRIVANSRSREMFTAFTLLIVLVVSAIMNLIGLSMALGSFLAGVVLADSEYRHELETDIEPFKGLLLGLFFMAVGMSINTDLLREDPGTIALWVGALIGFKFVAGFIAGKLFGFANEPARRLSLALAQGSEFGFVLFAQAYDLKLLDKLTSEKLILVISISLMTSPFLFIFYDRMITPRLLKKPKKEFDEIHDEGSQVIVAGLGRFGQVVVRLLRVREIPFTALDHDSEQVNVLRRFGAQVYYGDASRLDLLKMAGADRAKLFILAIDEVEGSLKVAEMVKLHFPNIKIMARARNRAHYFALRDLGVEVIEREVFWSSLKLAEKMLGELGTASPEVERISKHFTAQDFKSLDEQYKKHTDMEHLIRVSKEGVQQLSDLLKIDEKSL